MVYKLEEQLVDGSHPAPQVEMATRRGVASGIQGVKQGVKYTRRQAYTDADQ